MPKDWSGNQNSIYKTLGASNHTEGERQSDDYYATEPKAAELLGKRYGLFKENVKLEGAVPVIIKDDMPDTDD